MSTLLVPLDGSELAERALPYAVQQATASDSRLVLLRVALPATPMDLDGRDWEFEHREAIIEAEAYLASVASRLALKQPPLLEAVDGAPVAQILATVERYAADQIVLASHGRTGLSHLLHGSVTEGVLADSPVPVMVIHARPGQPPACNVPAPFSTIVVALDGSAFAEAALEPAVRILDRRQANARLILSLIVQPPDHVLRDEFGTVLSYLDQQEQARTWSAREYLLSVQRRLVDHAPGLRVDVDVRLGQPVQGLADVAHGSAADLLALATHARTGLQRAYLGSVAGAVLRTVDLPVLLVRPTLVSHQPAPPDQVGGRPWL